MKKPFLQAGFLHRLEHLSASTPLVADERLSVRLADLLVIADGTGGPTKAAIVLIQLLKAYEAILQAAFDTALAADELRRYQKFARPGQPSSHIVRLRQHQAAARQASSQSRQAFIGAAAAFVKAANIDLPPRTSLDVFMVAWIEANIPQDMIPTP